MKTGIFILAIIGTVSLNGQSGLAPAPGARGLALGGAGLTFDDINSIFSNQAGLAGLEQWAASVAAEQRFLVEALQTASLGIAYPTSSGTFGVSVHHFGFEDYREQRFGLAYGRKLMEGLSIGAQALLYHTNIPEYGSRSLLSFELGLQARISPEFRMGLHVLNPARIEILPDEYLPTMLRFGLAYAPSEKLLLLAEIEKDIAFPVRIRSGVEYHLAEPFYLRGGLATQPAVACFGLGYAFENGLGIDIASAYHQWLGFTPALSLSYRKK